MKKRPSTLNIHEIAYLLGLREQDVLSMIRQNNFPVVLDRGTIRIPAKLFNDLYGYGFQGGAA